MTQSYKTCPQCDKPNALEAQVCQHCGYAFAPEVTQPSQGQGTYGSFAPAPPPMQYPPMPQPGGYPPIQQPMYAPVPQQYLCNGMRNGCLPLAHLLSDKIQKKLRDKIRL